jgi:hypothetical protein
VLLGLGAITAPPVEPAEAEVAVSDQRPHTELLGPREGRVVKGGRLVGATAGRLRGDLGQYPQRVGLPTALAPLAAEVEGAAGHARRFVRLPVPQARLGEQGECVGLPPRG